MGRASVLCDMLRDLGRQTRQPDDVIICAPSEADMQGAAEARPGVRTLLGPRGLTKQRNAILAEATDADVLVFFDDDFFAAEAYLEEIENFMTDNTGAVVVTGSVIADGINGPGLKVSEGRILLSADTGRRIVDEGPRPVFTGYGCNMALRLAPLRVNELLFDERLPLYGWQEDVDLSRRLAAHGEVFLLPAARGVHLGAKVGRNSGVRLGYSQIANPLYIARKGEGYPMARALEHIARNVLANMVKTLRPEPYVDRRGRLKGNLIGAIDLLRGQLVPEKAEML